MWDKKQYMKEYNHRPEVIERNKIWNRNYKKSPEVRERLSEYQKEWRLNHLEYMREYIKGYQKRPEVKQQMSLRSKRRWQEYRQRIINQGGQFRVYKKRAKEVHRY